MGYLFPGVLCFMFLFLALGVECDMSKLTDFALLKDTLSQSSVKFDLDKSIVFVVLSYVLGHIISYASSLTVEQYANKVFEYPSVYLLEKGQKVYCQLWKDFFKSEANSSQKCLRDIKNILRFILKIIWVLIIFPISFTVYTLGYLFDLNGWIVRPLDGYLIETIKKKQYLLAQKLQINHPDVNDKKCDYHRIIQHYVYLNIPNSQRKTDNYIALYGFLRSMSLIFSIIFNLVACYGISTISWKADVNLYLCVLLLVLYLFSYLTFLGFMKFYRRFTLENYMSLLVGLYDSNMTKNDV